jgi:hypothetical protein
MTTKAGPLTRAYPGRFPEKYAVCRAFSWIFLFHSHFFAYDWSN